MIRTISFCKTQIKTEIKNKIKQRAIIKLWQKTTRQGFPSKASTFSAVLVRHVCPCLSPLPCLKNLLLFCQDFPVTVFSVTSHMAMWKTRLSFPFLLDVSMNHIFIGSFCYFSQEKYFSVGRVKTRGGWDLSSHTKKTLECAIYGAHLPSHWPYFLCTFIYPLEFINYEYIRLQVHNIVSRKCILIKYPNSMSG